MLLALGALITFMATVLVAGMAYQIIRAREDSAKYPPPGQMVDVGGYRLHLYSAGDDGPTVVFDAALGGSCLSWAHVQPEVAKFARTLSYDRAGMGWSDVGPDPRTAQQIVEELRALLHRGGVPGPYVLVGHSFGGFTARLYAARYPREVAGMVLVDVPDASEWLHNPVQKQRAAIGAQLSRRGVLVARLGIARLVAHMITSGARDAARSSVSFITGGILRGHADRIIAPLVRVPAEFRPILQSFWTHPKFYAALAGQMECMSETAAQLENAGGLGDMPLVVLTASDPSPARRAEQDAVAQLSSRGRHLIATRSGHWIQLDQPELVIEAVRLVVSQLRPATLVN
jgi:pimeloyl-ACP methyl ester carboxylesterase